MNSTEEVLTTVATSDPALGRRERQLDRPATALSLEQRQKLCVAQSLPVKPAVRLMDDPCSALDPAATSAVEELLWELCGEYTISGFKRREGVPA